MIDDARARLRGRARPTARSTSTASSGSATRAARALADGPAARRRRQRCATALDLWRGRPLADLDDEPFARDALARLEEARLEALERRIEADLAARPARRARRRAAARSSRAPPAARAAARAADARALPLRPPGRGARRLRGRAPHARRRARARARPAAAAAAAGDPRAGPGARPRARRPRRRRGGGAGCSPRARPRSPSRAGAVARRRLLGAAATEPAAGAAAAAPAASSSRSTPRPARRAPDRRPGARRRRSPSRDGRVWLVDADARTRARGRPALGRGRDARDGRDADRRRGRRRTRSGSRTAAARETRSSSARSRRRWSRLDPATRTRARRRRAAAPRGGAVSNLVENHLAVQRDAVWAVTPDFAVVRIDAGDRPRSRRPRARSRRDRRRRRRRRRLGARRRRRRRRASTSADARVRRRARASRPTRRGAIAVGDDAAWVTLAVGRDAVADRRAGRRRSARVELGAGHHRRRGRRATRRLGRQPARGHAVTQVDPRPDARRAHGRTSAASRASVAARRRTRSGSRSRGGARRRVDAEVAGVTPLPASTCEPVVPARTAEADVLVVSDLPLQGGVRVSATQMAQAITFVLREHGFRAGRFRVAYQSCDDSIARTGPVRRGEVRRERARLRARTADVVAVIGTFNSACAVAALPELNRAPGGPLAMVSPLELVRRPHARSAGRRPAAARPRSTRPAGATSCACIPTDDLQGAALALLARDRGRRRVFVLDDGEPGYGRPDGDGFATAARRLGLDGRRSRDLGPAGRALRGGSRGASPRAAPDAVFVGGLLDTNARARRPRPAAARSARRTTCSGPTASRRCRCSSSKAGDAPRAACYVSLAGAGHGAPAAGRRRASPSASRARRPARRVEPSAVYAAQATEVLLDAIARSDGTRASVLDELFRDARRRRPARPTSASTRAATSPRAR